MNDVAYARRQANRLFVALVADAATFALFMTLVGSASVHVERNPLIGATFAFAGIAGVIGLKLVAGIVIVWRAQRLEDARWHASFWWMYAFASSLVIAGTITGAGFNVASLLDSLR